MNITHFLLIFLLTIIMATRANAEMLVRFFHLTIDPNQSEQFMAVGLHNLSTSVREEQGTLAMYSLADKNAPNNHVVVEIYQDMSAYQLHTQSPQFQAFVDMAKDTIISKDMLTTIPRYLGEQKSPLSEIDNSALLINLVEVVVDPDQNAAYAEVVLPEMALTLDNEPNVLVMYAVNVANEPNRWLFFEVYASEKDYQFHRQQPYFVDYLAKTKSMVLDKSFKSLAAGILLNKGGLHFTQ